MREKIKKNYKIQLYSLDKEDKKYFKEYIVTSCIGEGASCLVYDAQYLDDIGIYRNVRIKELYPLYCCDTARMDQEISWRSEEVKTKAY